MYIAVHGNRSSDLSISDVILLSMLLPCNRVIAVRKLVQSYASDIARKEETLIASA